jgi:L-threonylcarbamoyladenylate synthase
MTSTVPAWRLNLLASLLRDEAVVAYPTEGVWGLGCIPESMVAVSRILAIKMRSWEQGLILVGSHIDQFSPYLEGLDNDQLDMLEDAWPGPVTYLVPDNGYCPIWIKGHHQSVALRVTGHPVVHALCHQLGSPMVSTSLNRAGQRPVRTRLEVRQKFAEEIDAIVPGDLGNSNKGASEIRDLVSGEVIRSRP